MFINIFSCSIIILDDAETNLKLYIDKHGGGVTIAGHNLEDRCVIKKILV